MLHKRSKIAGHHPCNGNLLWIKCHGGNLIECSCILLGRSTKNLTIHGHLQINTILIFNVTLLPNEVTGLSSKEKYAIAK